MRHMQLFLPYQCDMVHVQKSLTAMIAQVLLPGPELMEMDVHLDKYWPILTAFAPFQKCVVWQTMDWSTKSTCSQKCIV